jgi:thiol-disulfide isomerase/thioredoxin
MLSILATFLFLLPFALQGTDVTNLLEQGDAATKKHDYAGAEKLYRTAERASGNKCTMCNIKLAELYTLRGDLDFAIQFGKKAIEEGQTQEAKLYATIYLGRLELGMADVDPEKVKPAEKVLRTAVSVYGNSPQPQLFLAQCLLVQRKDQEARKLLTELIQRFPETAEGDVAKKWLAEPRFARFVEAPAFSLTTRTGEKLTRDSLKGKTLVIDFWGTWCPPCVASVGEIKDLTRKYPKDRFALVSVSVHDKKEDWSRFIEARKMDWPQHFDEKREMATTFSVHSFPTYIVIDKDGFIRARISGLNPQQTVTSRLKETLQQLDKE